MQLDDVDWASTNMCCIKTPMGAYVGLIILDRQVLRSVFRTYSLSEKS